LVTLDSGMLIPSANLKQWNKNTWLSLGIILKSCSHFRIQPERLDFKPLLPNGLSELIIRGVSYLGNKMDWMLRKDEVCVILREQSTSVEESAACALKVVLQGTGRKIPLVPGNKQPKNNHPELECGTGLLT
jgi:hypothetical protein